MAVDKLVDSTQLDADLTSVANAIREKGGTSAELAFPTDFVSAIEAISGGGSGGIKLLASDDYTRAGTAAAFTIPVTYTGTPYFAYVVADSPPSDVAQTIWAWKCYRAFEPTLAAWFPSVGFGQARARKADNTAYYYSPAVNASNVGEWKITATELKFTRVNNAYPWQAGVYHWFIWGTEE